MNTGPFYLGVGNRCAVDLDSLDLAISNQEALDILTSKGFRVIDVSLTALARSLVGISEYKRHCQASEAPEYLDCSSLIKWIYSKKGIWLPRHPIDQRNLGFMEVPWQQEQLQEGDLLFTSGRRTLYWSNPEKGVGHVGVVTNIKTVIHAANPRLGVVEIPLAQCLTQWQDRGAIRIISNPRTFTIECPSNQLVEYSAAFRWKILSSTSNPSQP